MSKIPKWATVLECKGDFDEFKIYVTGSNTPDKKMSKHIHIHHNGVGKDDSIHYCITQEYDPITKDYTKNLKVEIIVK